MKKCYRILISILCFIPLLVNAGTLEDGKNIANKYMQDNFEADYSRYIVSEDTKYGFNKNGIFSVSGFKKGGLINKYEFELSKEYQDKNDSSWLFDVNGYWSLTDSEDGKAYVVGKGNYSKTDIFNNRVVEYVRNSTSVSGKGTYSNPWIINKTYRVTIKVNRENVMEAIKVNNKKCGEDKCETNVFMNKDAVFNFTFKDGYEFDSSSEGNNLCNASGYSASLRKLVIPNIMDDYECVFKVKERDYKITFNPNGGTLSGDASKNVTYSKEYGVLPEPTKEGYAFDGWYTDPTSGSRVDSSSTLDNPSDQTLYAHWSANSYTVIFDANGGTVTSGSKDVSYDSTYGSLPTATKEGYTLDGWYTEATGGSKVTDTTIVKITSTQTLYAQWKANSYNITFNANGGTVSSSSKSVVYKSTYGTLPTATRSGYTFDGWYTSASGGNKIDSSSTLDNPSDQTLYAHWSANSYTVTFNANGGTASSSSKSVVYDSTYGTLPTATRSGYTFNGWYTSASGGSKVTNTTTVKITSNQTLYAQWKANSYTVTFNANGGSISSSSKSVVYDSTYGTLPTATRSGYTFNGWYTSASGGSKVTNTTTVKITSNQTLYAQWKAISVSVTFVLSNGQSNVTKTINYGDKYTFPTGYTTPTCQTLTGWYDESGNKITSDTVMSKTTSHTITARWASSMVTPTYSNVKNYLSYTGGWQVKSDSGGWYIRFTSSGTLTVKACMNVDLSLIGGGGGGGGGRFDGPSCQGGAGGSAGYTNNISNVTLKTQTYSITIGAGGSGGGNGGVGGNGGTTKFGSYTASGGGGSNNGTARSEGGSGGGASGNTYTYIQGGAGGSNGSDGANTYNGGGGGQGTTTRGFASTSYTLFSGGGGGGTLAYTISGYYDSQPGGYGGDGGGARGGGNNNAAGTSASANTGGGGGGGGCYCYSMSSGTGYGGGAGGSGIVLMRNKR